LEVGLVGLGLGLTLEVATEEGERREEVVDVGERVK
jgi:hypothetical protein